MSLAAQLLETALSRGGDHADIFAQQASSRSLSFEEGKVKSAHQSASQGIGIRVVVGEATGYAYCEIFDEATLLATARRASQIAHGQAAPSAMLVGTGLRHDLYRAEHAPAAAPMAERVALLRRMSEHAYAHDPQVQWVSCQLADQDETVTIATSDGVYATDHRPMLRVSVAVHARSGARRESGSAGGGGRLGLEYFTTHPPEELAAKAARQAVTLLTAVPCPAGQMPVVLAPASSGILIHEAVGHGLEADFNRIGVSAYSGQIGAMVASPLVTVVDDGTIPGDRGAINIDDEGVASRRTTLIEQGRLCGYLHDRTTARLMGAAPTGNGRRDGYGSVPIPRMRVTFLAAGEDDPAEIIRSIPRGLYAVSFGGGSVDIAKGDFNFHVTEGYLIEDGRIGPAVSRATLIGNGPEVLRRVTRVGNDLALADGQWTCGKDGQSCPVGQGMPTTLISEMTVGGRS